MKAFALVAVPPTVVTVMLFKPAVPAGVFAEIMVEVLLIIVAATPPTFTLVAPVKFVPVIVIGVPPATGPEIGATVVIVGSATFVNALALVAVPPTVVTATSFAPAAPAGVTAVMEVELTATTLVAATPPTFTVAPARKFVPVRVRIVPAASGPALGVTEVSVGAAAYVNAPVLVTDPPRVCTKTLATIFVEPVIPVGVLAVIEVGLTTTTLVAATPFTFTLVAPVKLVPVIVKAVPPAIDPEAGLTVVIVGAPINLQPSSVVLAVKESPALVAAIIK